MFIHVGVEERVKSLGESYEYCQACNGETIHAHREVRRWFTLYWIPMFPIEAPKRADYCRECVSKARQISAAPDARQHPSFGSGEAQGSDIDALRKKVQRGR